MEQNRKWKTRNPVRLAFIILVSLSFTLFHFRVNAQTAVVDGTVQISVCGNGVKEGGEECDNEDHNNKTCVSYGYGSGTLTCTSGCIFNTTQCVPAPVSPDSEGDENDDDNEEDDGDNGGSSSQSDSTQDALEEQVLINATPLLPSYLIPFDSNGDNRISTAELYNALVAWAASWKEGRIDRCDVNSDSACDVRDFSVLLHYVDIL